MCCSLPTATSLGSELAMHNIKKPRNKRHGHQGSRVQEDVGAARPDNIGISMAQALCLLSGLRQLLMMLFS